MEVGRETDRQTAEVREGDYAGGGGRRVSSLGLRLYRNADDLCVAERYVCTLPVVHGMNDVDGGTRIE